MIKLKTHVGHLHLSIWQMLLKATYIAFKVYILLVYAYPGIKPMILALAPWSTVWTAEILEQHPSKPVTILRKMGVFQLGPLFPSDFNGIWTIWSFWDCQQFLVY